MPSAPSGNGPTRAPSGTSRDVSLFISTSRRAIASTDRNSSSRNARRHSRRLSFPLVVFGMVRARTSRTSRSSSRNPCDAATATRTSSTSFAAERALDAEGSPSRTSATTITTGFDAVSSATNAAMPPGRRRPAPASATTRSMSCGATLRPPTTMRSFERPTRKSSPSRRKPSSPVRRYALDATDRAPGEATRETPPHSPASSASFAPNPYSPSHSSSSFPSSPASERRYPNATESLRIHTSPTNPSGTARRVSRSTTTSVTSSHGAPQLATRTVFESSSSRDSIATRSRSSDSLRIVAYPAPPSHAYTTHSARPYPATSALGRNPCGSNARAKMADVSGCTRSDALRQRLSEDKSTEDTSVSRPSAGDTRHRSARHPSHRSAHRRYAKSGACVIVARYLDMISGHVVGSRMNDPGLANTHVVDAGASTSSPAMVSGARYPPTRPMS